MHGLKLIIARPFTNFEKDFCVSSQPMTRIFFLATVALIGLLQSCGGDNRHKIEGAKLTVYYFQESEMKTAEKVAFFWKERGFLTGEKQDLQLRKVDNKYTLSMIANDKDAGEKMTFDDIQLLMQLKRRLWEDVFEEKSFNFEICNNKFETIYTVE